MINVDNDFDFQVDTGLTVIKFWATWCGPCKKMEPTMKQLESEFTTIKFLSVDVDTCPSLAQKFKIKMLPTVLVLKDDAEINRVTGMSLIEPLRKLFRDSTQKILDPVI